ncbi:hypothetical protein RB195_004556 [Necator americanus]|uniref:Uncharacterized protein n=1 Tax=Necator americanus TaxID=51031 RepID=A0ABR1BKC2_NECAM
MRSRQHPIQVKPVNRLLNAQSRRFERSTLPNCIELRVVLIQLHESTQRSSPSQLGAIALAENLKWDSIRELEIPNGLDGHFSSEFTGSGRPCRVIMGVGRQVETDYETTSLIYELHCFNSNVQNGKRPS